MQDIWKLENTRPGQGLFTLTWVSYHNKWRTFTLEAKGASQITLMYSGQFVA